MCSFFVFYLYWLLLTYVYALLIAIQMESIIWPFKRRIVHILWFISRFRNTKLIWIINSYARHECFVFWNQTNVSQGVWLTCKGEVRKFNTDFTLELSILVENGHRVSLSYENIPAGAKHVVNNDLFQVCFERSFKFLSNLDPLLWNLCYIHQLYPWYSKCTPRLTDQWCLSPHTKTSSDNSNVNSHGLLICFDSFNQFETMDD